MFGDPIGIYPDLTGSNSVGGFAKVSQGIANSRYQKFDATVGDPYVFLISHTTAGKGQAMRDRHLLRFEANGVVDGVNDPTKVVAIYTVADVPRYGITRAQTIKVMTYLSGFLRGSDADTPVWDGTSVFARLMNGES